MHSFIDQINNLLVGTQNNLLNNSELYSDHSATNHFSSLLNLFVGPSQDANIAALPGNLGTSNEAELFQNITSTLNGANSNTSEQGSNQVYLASTSTQNVSESSNLLDGADLSENISVDDPKKLLDNSAIPLSSISLTNQVNKINKPTQSGDESVGNVSIKDQLPELDRTSEQTTVRKIDYVAQAPQNEGIARFETVPFSNKQVSEINAGNQNYNSKSSSSVDVDLANGSNPLTSTQAKQPEHSPSVLTPLQSVAQNDVKYSVPASQADKYDASAGRRLHNTPTVGQDGLVDSKKVSDAPNQANSDNQSSNRFVNGINIKENLTVETNVLSDKRAQFIASQLESSASSNVQKEAALASISNHEVNDQLKRADARIKLAYESGDQYKLTYTLERFSGRAQERPLIQQESLSVNLPTASIEQTQTLKGLETNIENKIPSTASLISDSSSALKPLSADSLAATHKSALVEDSSFSSLKGNEIRNGNNIADQIAWAQRNSAQQLRISIAPEHLGAIEINIDDAAEGLNIHFVAQNAMAKDALESFMPRLKDMLEQSGLTLQNANVSQQGDGKSNFNLADQSKKDSFDTESTGTRNTVQNDLAQPSLSTESNYLLDAFA